MAAPVNIQPMTASAAKHIIRWSYDAPYDLYNFDISSASHAASEIAFLTDPDKRYYGVWQAGSLIGFCCFGAEARVPGGDYASPALDIGMGMRPDLTGKGNGEHYIQAVLDFARAEFAPTQCRATVAAFNERAQRACKKAGLTVVQTFVSTKTQQRFVVLVGPKNATATEP